MLPLRALSLLAVVTLAGCGTGNGTGADGGLATGGGTGAGGGTATGGGTTAPHWSRRTPSVSPSTRMNAALAFDAQRHRTMLFGGYSNGTSLGDTWAWDGTNWQQLTPANSPAAGCLGPMAYDAARAVVVLAATCSSTLETWEWSGTNWSKKVAAAPSARQFHALAFDGQRNVTVLFGGYSNGSYLNDTWTWDGTAWHQQSPSTSPPSGCMGSMAYDSVRLKTVLWCAVSGGSNETWEWDGTSWAKLNVTGPAARTDGALAFDAALSRTILFGGYQGGSYLRDTWSWNGSMWESLATVGGPTSDLIGALSFDSSRGALVLFGSPAAPSADAGVATETWELN